MTTEERLEHIDASIAQLNTYLLQMRGEVISRLDIIENRLDVLAAMINNIDARFPIITKAVIDFGVVATKLTRDQARLESKLEKPA